MPVKKPNKLNLPVLFTPRPLPPPDRNMYKRKGNKDLPLPARLPAPAYKLPSPIKIDSLPSTYMNSKTTIFPTDKSLSNFKTQSLSPSPILPAIIVKTNKKKLHMKRCKRGTRRNKKTMLCEKNKYYMRKLFTKRTMKRCPKGQHRNPINSKCEQKSLWTQTIV